jgi:hypothetical protein
MATRTYAPQMARLLQHVVRYQNRHASKIAAVASGTQNADLAVIVAAINNSWIAVQTTETP